MTVIIGYINSNKNDIASALYSDNLELEYGCSTRKVADKIIKIDDRYIIAVIGLGLVKIIINSWITDSEEFQSSKQSFEYINQLMQCIEKGINKFIVEWKKNENYESYMNKYDQNESSLVILDKKKNNLYYVKLGKILKGEIKTELKQLERGILYEFGIPASQNNREYNIEFISLFNKVSIDLLIKEKLNNIHSKNKADIGILGSHFIKINEDEEFIS